MGPRWMRSLLVVGALLLAGPTALLAQIGPVGTRPLPEPEWRLTPEAAKALEGLEDADTIRIESRRNLGSGVKENNLFLRLADGKVVPLAKAEAQAGAVVLKKGGDGMQALQPDADGDALYLTVDGASYPLEVVDGRSRTHISGGASVAANTNGSQGTGVTYLGFQNYGRNSFLSGYLNYSPIRLLGADSLAQGMLNPGADTLSFQLAGIQFAEACPQDPTRHGLSGRLQWSKVGFAGVVKDGDEATTQSLDCGLLSGYAGYRLAHNFRRGANPMAAGLDAGLATRWLMGEAGRNAAFRESLFGGGRKFFWGPELTFYFSLNEYTPYARLTRFQGTLEGFSEWQVSIGLNVDTSLAGL